MRSLAASLVLAVACSGSTAPVPLSRPLVRLTSDRGDYIGAGERHTYRSPEAAIVLEATGGRLDVHVRGAESWDGSFMAPTSRDRIRPGRYTGLGRFDTNAGGMEWTGQSRGCNVLSGWFSVDAVDYDANGLAAIKLRFEQHCESGAPALHGMIAAGQLHLLPL